MPTLEERNYQRACGTKTKYLNKKEASKVSIKMEERKGIPFSPYQCKYCHFWHVGKDRKLLVE
jgi:hypothetical protein